MNKIATCLEEVCQETARGSKLEELSRVSAPVIGFEAGEDITKPGTLAVGSDHVFKPTISITFSQDDPSGSSTAQTFREDIQRVPKLTWPSKTHPALDNKVCDLLETLWAIVVSHALAAQFPIAETRVITMQNPESGVTRAVLVVSTPVKIGPTIAFWDSLETRFSHWLSGLPEHLRDKFHSKISLHFHWAVP